jgi:hypothetical protein
VVGRAKGDEILKIPNDVVSFFFAGNDPGTNDWNGIYFIAQ